MDIKLIETLDIELIKTMALDLYKHCPDLKSDKYYLGLADEMLCHYNAVGLEKELAKWLFFTYRINPEDTNNEKIKEVLKQST